MNNNEQETSEVQFEVMLRAYQRPKPQKREPADSSTRTIPIGERSGTDIEPQDYSSIDDPVSKQLIHLLRHGNLLREDDGAIEFWRLKRLSSELFCVLSSLV